MKRRITFRLNTALIERLDEQREKEGRRQNAIIEQALAEYLNVPLANRELPEQPVELCPRCERGVLNDGRCAQCNWRRHDPREDRHARAGETYRETNPKYAKWIKEAA